MTYQEWLRREVIILRRQWKRLEHEAEQYERSGDMVRAVNTQSAMSRAREECRWYLAQLPPADMMSFLDRWRRAEKYGENDDCYL